LAFGIVEFTIGHVGNCHYVSLHFTESYSSQIDTVTAALAVTLPTDVAPLLVDEINTVAIANSQINDNLHVRKSRDCAACDIGLCMLDWMVSFS